MRPGSKITTAGYTTVSTWAGSIVSIMTSSGSKASIRASRSASGALPFRSAYYHGTPYYVMGYMHSSARRFSICAATNVIWCILSSSTISSCAGATSASHPRKKYSGPDAICSERQQEVICGIHRLEMHAAP